MTAAWTRCAEQIARAGRERKIRQVSAQLKTLFGDGAVVVEEARVLVRGRGIVKRWLIDPSLRFLGGGAR